jgi:exocyst complex protein 7
MNIIEERTFEITSKLEKEKANLSLLTERLKKSSQLTKGIDTILNTFEERLSRLEDTILPVYNDTENLQKSQQSILDSRPPSLSLFFIYP